VFGTLHTTTAISTVDRLIDQFPPDQQQQIRIMLAGTLKGVIAQNLLKRKGGGRVAALEVLVVNPAVSALIREAKTNQIMSIMQTAKKEGMTLLNEELARLVKQDVVEADEAWQKAVDKDGFVKALESLGVTYKPAND
jgi:twitching motility protein PilT